MSKKKSLGHVPLGYSMTGNATFDFIPDRSTPTSVEIDEPAEKLMKDNDEPVVIKKKVVSYYLDEDIVKRLKRVADENDESYSAVVSAAIDVYTTYMGH